jgi:hypothetical protein
VQPEFAQKGNIDISREIFCGEKVSAVFATTSSLDAEQTASLHFLAAPMLKMNCAASRNQIKEWLVLEGG